MFDLPLQKKASYLGIFWSLAALFLSHLLNELTLPLLFICEQSICLEGIL